MPQVIIFNQNATGTSYDVKIRPHRHARSYTNFYHVEKGHITAYPNGSTLKKQKNPQHIAWEQLDIRIRKFHANQVYHKKISHKEYIQYVYGGEAKSILDFEDWLNSQKYLPKNVAWMIYKQIGKYKKPKLLQNSKYVKIYLINDEYYVILQKETQKFVLETKEEFQNLSSRLKNILEKTNMPNEIVSIVKLIKDDSMAIKALKKLEELRFNSRIMEKFRKFDYYHQQNFPQAEKIEANGIKKDLEKIFGKKTFTQMNLSKSKFTKLAYYLLNNS